MANITIKYEELAECKTRLYDIYNNILSATESMKGYFDQVDQDWEGKKAEEYIETVNKYWNQGNGMSLNTFITTQIGNIATLIDKALEEYKGADKEVEIGITGESSN